MNAVLIRHGEADYAPCYARGFIGHGRDLAALTPEGVRQAEAVAGDPALTGSACIVASPYTRALQTAAIISRHTGLEIAVELDLHEFLPDKTYQYKGKEASDALHADFIACKGAYPAGEMRKWETIAEIAGRSFAVLKRYMALDQVIVVAHGGVIRRYTGVAEVKHCTPYPVAVDERFVCHGWV